MVYTTNSTIFFFLRRDLIPEMVVVVVGEFVKYFLSLEDTLEPQSQCLDTRALKEDWVDNWYLV